MKTSLLVGRASRRPRSTFVKVTRILSISQSGESAASRRGLEMLCISFLAGIDRDVILIHHLSSLLLVSGAYFQQPAPASVAQIAVSPLTVLYAEIRSISGPRRLAAGFLFIAGTPARDPNDTVICPIADHAKRSAQGERCEASPVTGDSPG